MLNQLGLGGRAGGEVQQQSVVRLRDAVGRWTAYGEAYDRPETFEPVGETRADDPLLLYFTSGTTSRPKLVLHTHRSYPVGHLSTMY